MTSTNTVIPHLSAPLIQQDEWMEDSTAEKIVKFIEERKQAMDDAKTVRDEAKRDELLKSAYDGAECFLPAVLTTIMGACEIAVHAPLVGVAFAFLKVVGAKVTRVSAMQLESEYKLMHSRVKCTVSLFISVGSPVDERHHGAVKKAFKSFLNALGNFVDLAFKYRDKEQGWCSKMWHDKSNRKKFNLISAQIDVALDDLMLVLALTTNETVENIEVKVNEMQRVLLSKIEGLQEELRKRHDEQLDFQRKVLDHIQPPLVPIDHAAYAEGIKSTLGRLAGTLVDAAEAESGGYKELSLQKVYVVPDVCEFQPKELDVAPLQSSQPALDLVDIGRVHQQDKAVVQARLDRSRHIYELRWPLPILSVLNDESIRLAVILGAPGSGKSSALCERALAWADNPDLHPFPILVELNKVVQQFPEAITVESIRNYVMVGGCIRTELKRTTLDHLLTTSDTKVLVMFDGLDEIFDQSKREAAVGAIATFARTYDCPTIRIMVTSRVVGYDGKELAQWGFKHYLLQPLTKDQVKSFVEQWHQETYSYAQGEVKKKRFLSAIENSSSVQELSTNPLLLTMIAMVNRGPILPTERVQLYDKCTELLISLWKPPLPSQLQANDERHIAASRVTYSIKTEILCNLALNMQDGAAHFGNLVSRDVLDQTIRDVCKSCLRCSEDTAATIAIGLIKLLEQQHGLLCFVGGDWYSFVHRTFLEYFCAHAIKRKWLDKDASKSYLEDLYRMHMKDSTWEEVLSLISGLVESKDMENCLSLLLSNHYHLLAARCVEQLSKRNAAGSVVEKIRVALVAIARTDHEMGRYHQCMSPSGDSAVDQLASTWCDDTTRAMLVEVARMNSCGSSAAVNVLASKWGDAETRAVVVEVAKMGLSGSRAAVDALASKWGDAETRAVLMEIARTESIGSNTAMNALTSKWGDAARYSPC